MSTNEVNMLPIQQFINAVKGADAKKSREIKLDIDTAKRLAFTLGEVMTRMNGDLEEILIKKRDQEDVIQVTMDGGGGWK